MARAKKKAVEPASIVMPNDPERTVSATRKIAIFGTTPSRMQGPINEKDWEIWTIGPGGKDVHRNS